jgi:hypothetical protein
MEKIQQLNYLPIIIASLIPFALGGFWYSPSLFGDVWKREAGTEDQEVKRAHTMMVYVTSWVLSFITVIAFSLYLGEKPTLEYAVKQALFIGCFFVATSFGINYLFSKRSFNVFLIDSLYYITQFILYGTILSILH